MGPYDEEEDFVWRFRLDEYRGEEVYDNQFVDMIRLQIEQLLNIIRFTSKGDVVGIDGFEMLSHPGKIYHLFPNTVKL